MTMIENSQNKTLTVKTNANHKGDISKATVSAVLKFGIFSFVIAVNNWLPSQKNKNDDTKKQNKLSVTPAILVFMFF